jgi:hypothetical protein
LQDRHLYEWECDERAKVIRQRRALALAWVQRLAELYEHVTVETYSLAVLVRRDQPMEIPEARHVRFIVAPGELRAKLVSELGSDRVTRLKVAARTLPHLCADGGSGMLGGDRARELVLVCDRCGAEVDQDANNAKNQLATAAE